MFRLTLTLADTSGNDGNSNANNNGIAPDIKISISATPQIFKKYSTETIRLSAKNVGNTDFKKANVYFKFPDKTVTGGNNFNRRVTRILHER